MLDNIPTTTANDKRSPTIETVVIILAVFGIQLVLSGLFVGLAARHLFVLTPRFLVELWTLVTSVYSHAGMGNATVVRISIIQYYMALYGTTQ